MYAIGHQGIVFIVLPADDRHDCLCFHAHVFQVDDAPRGLHFVGQGRCRHVFVHGGGLRHLYGRVRDCRLCVRRYSGYGNRLGFGRSVRLVDDLCCVRATLRLQARQGGTSVHGSTVPLRGGSFVFGHAVRSMAQGCSRRMRIRCQRVAFGFGDS